jgi:broad specificity phosphatase PhoE
MAVYLYLIRHGETTWSLTHQHTGRTDIPLTEHGEEEASQLGKRLSGTKFTHVFSSPSRRAQRTCEMVEAATAPKIEVDLAEWDYGDYEGSRTVDIRKVRPNWNIFRDGCPGGETPGQISERADRLIARLRTLDGKVALFSHGQFGCVLAARWIGLPVIEGPHFVLGTASLSILGYDLDHPKVSVIALWNAFSHEMLELLPHQTLGDTRTMKERAIQRWETDGGEISDDRSQPTGVRGSQDSARCCGVEIQESCSR